MICFGKGRNVNRKIVKNRINMQKRKKIKLNINGDIQKHSYKIFSFFKTKRHGVKTHSIDFVSDSDIEVILEGDRKDLLELARWNAKGPVFCTVDELVFQFME